MTSYPREKFPIYFNLFPFADFARIIRHGRLLLTLRAPSLPRFACKAAPGERMQPELEKVSCSAALPPLSLSLFGSCRRGG